MSREQRGQHRGGGLEPSASTPFSEKLVNGTTARL
jgi:hypothetical protein